MDTVARGTFLFEGFTLDTVRGCLRDDTGEISLRPKSFAVLLYLVVNRDRLVPKEELIRVAWPNVVVGEDSLARCVSEIRSALRDRKQAMIKTVWRRGYRFVAPVRHTMGTQRPAWSTGVTGTDPSSSDTPQTQGARPLRRRGAGGRRAWQAIAFSLVLVGSVGSGAWFLSQSSRLPLPDRPSIAVLPFDEDSGDPKRAYLGNGIAESLTAKLSKFTALIVIASSSATKHRGDHRDVQQIGRELGVRYVVRGRVNREPGRVRISAQLIDSSNRRQLWAEHYDREFTDILTIQDEVARNIVVTLVARISKSELDRVLLKRPESWTAYDYYLRGNSIVRSANGQDRAAAVSAAIKLYEQALAADPHFALAIQGLAQAYVMMWQGSTRYDPATNGFNRQELLERAFELARRAVDLDGNLAEARATLAFVLRWKDRPAEALGEYERAFALNPNLADGRLAEILIQQGRAPEAITLIKRIMRLDPHHPPQHFQALGNAYYLVGEYEAAAEQFRMATARIPDCLPAYVGLAAAAAQSGRDGEARRSAAQATRLIPTFTIARWLALMRFAKPTDAAHLAEGLRRAGFSE